MKKRTVREQEVKNMIMVDHAGEYGATRIYAGQIAVLKNSKVAPTISHMADQEQKHLEKFNEILNERRVRPTAMMPLWHIAGYALGAGTALLGEKAAMACTVAVEEVIDQHYQEQYNSLGDNEKELKQVIEKFRQEELEHRDTGLEYGAEETPGYEVLTAGVKLASRMAIWLSSRI